MSRETNRPTLAEHLGMTQIGSIVQKKFFDDNKKLEKVETADDLKNVSNSIYRADSITMKNFKKKHKTVLKSKGREINKGLSVNLFTVRELEKAQ